MANNQIIDVPQIKSKSEAIAIAKRLHSNISSRAAQAEQGRRVPQETIRELIESGLFGVVTPKVFGGSELGISTLFDVAVEISSACSSTGWVYGVLAGHSWLVNLFPEQAQKDVLGDPTALTATVFRLAGTITEVEGGYKLVNGKGGFASGVDHASWVIVGNAVKRADGSEEPHFFIVSKDDIEVVDDWDVNGMRATGSKTIKIAEAFIPAHRAIRLADMVGGTTPGANVHSGNLYRLPFSDVAPFSIIASPLGTARGAVEVVAKFQRQRLASASALEVADASDTLSRLAAAKAKIDAAIALVRASAEQVDAVTNPDDLTELDHVEIPRNWAYAAHACREAVNSLYEVSGGAQIYNRSELQRYWRDVNSGAQHFAFSWENSMKNYGRAMVGVSTVAYTVKRG